MFYQKLSKFFASDIGIDLGTANCLVYVKGQGIVLREPSVVAIAAGTNEVVAVGSDAKRMLGRTPGNIKALRPMKDGVIADFEIAEEMLRTFIQKARQVVPWSRRILSPRVLIAIPSGITEVESRAVKESALHAGASMVSLVKEPMAAAIGVGLKIEEPSGSMIVDIGGGTTEVAVISYYGIVESRSIRVGGDEMDIAIAEFLKKKHSLMIGERTSEEIKIKIGSAYSLGEEETMEVKGRSVPTGLPKTVAITTSEVREALKNPVNSIVHAVTATLERCPPELAADLIGSGIMLAGGGAMLKGLDKLLAEITGLPVLVADNPLQAVVNGTGKMLEEMNVALEKSNSGAAFSR